MDLTAAIAAYQAATEEFLSAVKKLSADDLDRTEGDGWSPRQVIHHVADSEAQSYARLRRLIVEPGTQIQGYDEGAWGEHSTLGYKELPIEISLNVFSAVRASSLEILKRLKPEQLNNAGVHSESGEYSINTWLATYIKHPSEHAEQLGAGL
ncbi:metal-dependent hydrolase [Candidatus Nanopelagicaceae bacterium]